VKGKTDGHWKKNFELSICRVVATR